MVVLFVSMALLLLFVGTGVFMCIRINHNNEQCDMEDLTYLEKEGVEFIAAKMKEGKKK